MAEKNKLVWISERTHALLQVWAKLKGKTMQEVADDLLKEQLELKLHDSLQSSIG